MNCTTIVRQVAVRIYRPKPRLRWGYIIGESEGLSLVMVPASTQGECHQLLLAQLNVAMGFYVSLRNFRFDLDTAGLINAGNRLKVLGMELHQKDFERLLDMEE